MRRFLITLLGVAMVLGLAMAMAVLVLPSCGLRLGSYGDLDFCLATIIGPAPVLAAEQERRAVLEDRVGRLERQLAGLPACPPPEPPPPPPPEPPPPPPPEPEEEPDLGLDADRWDEQDEALLEGCWALASDYQVQDRETGAISTVASWEMCFDAEGRGDQRMVMTDGRVCASDVDASFTEDGSLQVHDQSNVECDNNSYIYRRIMTCTLEPNGEAACDPYQPEVDSRSSEVRITRRVSP